MPIMKIDFTDSEMFELRGLLKKTPLKNTKELVLSGLGVLNWIVDETSKGKCIASVDKNENTFTEIKIFKEEEEKG